MIKRHVIILLFWLMLPLWAAGQPYLHNLEVKVNIRDNGDAVVTEKRTMTITSKGTECYIPMEGLRGITLSDFKVSDETGRDYALVGWDVSATRSQKEGHCGIVSKGEGAYELCWGLDQLKAGESQKDKVYTISYTLGSLMKSYNEAEGFNHMFVNPGIYPLPEKVSLRVEMDSIQLDTSNARGWAFGYYGSTEFTDGGFEAWTENFTSSSSMIIMLALKKDFIYPSDTLDTDFQEVVDYALEGASFGGEYDGEEQFFTDDWATWICGKLGINKDSIIQNVSTAICIAFIGLFFLLMSFLKSILTILAYIISLKPLRVLIRRLKISRKANGGLSPWQREIPFNGSLFAAGKALNTLSYKETPDINNILGAFILRLFQRGELLLTWEDGKQTIRIGEHTDQTDNPQKTDGNIKSPADIRMENTLYYIFKSAAGKDGVLQENELKRWLKNKNSYAEKLLELRNTTNKPNKEELAGLMRLKKFLQDFTLIEERGVVEVKLWDEYLVFATLLGIADQVRKDFRKVCPEYFAMSKFATAMENASFDFSTTVYSIANYTANAAEYSRLSTERAAAASSMWSGGSGGSSYRGGGGHSSFSGGGGHSGGGGGGGIR